jgi:hypothetical protein
MMNVPTADAVTSTGEKGITDDFASLKPEDQEAIVKEYYSGHIDKPFEVWYSGRDKDKGEPEEDAPAPESTDTGADDVTTTDDAGGDDAQEENEDGDGTESETPDNVVSVSKADLERLKNADQLRGQLANEVGRYRQYQPFIDALNDPAFRSHVEKFYGGVAQPQQQEAVPQDFDPYNPQHIDRLVEQRVQAKIKEQTTQFQRQQAAAKMQEWNAREQATRQRIMTERGLDEPTVMGAMQALQKKFSEGGIAEVAIAFTNHESEIKAAEKRGYDKAMKRVQEKTQGAPKRTAGAVKKTGGRSADGKGLAELTVDELADAISRTAAGTPEFEALGREIERRGNRRR